MPIANTKNYLPLNEYLVQRRKFLKIRFGDLVLRTGLSAKHLKKIEKGDWCDLPSGVYVKGFLKKYAQAVGLDEAEISLRYENEWKKICFIPSYTDGSKISSGFPDFIKRISLRRATALLLVFVVLGYISWQFKVILENPELSLSYPKEDSFIAADYKIVFAGKFSPGAALSVNGENIYAEENDSFVKEVELLPGLNVFEFKAVSRFGKERKIIKRITYQQNN